MSSVPPPRQRSYFPAFSFGDEKGARKKAISEVSLLHHSSLCRKLRWHSFQNSHRPSLNSESLEINRQFASQIHLLHKCSLLRLTAFMEKYTIPQKHGWGW